MSETSTSVSLVPVSVAHIDDLVAMMIDFNALEHITWTRESGEAALRRLLSDASLGAIRFIVEGEVTVGYFVVTFGYDLEWNGRDAFLTELYLIESARGHGVGAQAIALVEAFAKEHGVRALHLMVRDDNEVAHRLYLRSGFASPPRKFLSKELPR